MNSQEGALRAGCAGASRQLGASFAQAFLRARDMQAHPRWFRAEEREEP